MIHILDQLSVLPGHFKEVWRRVDEDYRPVVTDLGLRLAGCWMAPPVELLDDPTDLMILWEVDGVDEYWAVKRAAGRDPRVLAFWDSVGPLLADRERRIMGPVP